MRDNNLLRNQIDWITIIAYFALVVIGILNIYSVNYDASHAVFDLSTQAGRQLIFLVISVIVGFAIMLLDYLLFTSTFVYFLYGSTICLLILVLFVGRDVGGAKAWIDLPMGLKLQPSELTKIAISLVLAKLYNEQTSSENKTVHYLKIAGILFLPTVLILMQPDPGTLIVFIAFLIVMYREGMTPLVLGAGILLCVIFMITLIFAKEIFWIKYIVLGLGLVWIFFGKDKKRISTIAIKMGITVVVFFSIVGMNFVYHRVLKPHHRDRIQVLLDPSIAPQGIGYNINQAKIAIGAGGLFGQGFLQGKQTRGKFVPEQSTDFIFCTIGEEHGLLGTGFTIGLMIFLILRVIWMAERQKVIFGRVYGYCVASILFMHFVINIGMVLALFPVIGIPLPFLSYGGSSLFSFTILLFIMIKFDAHRMQMLKR